MGRTAAVAPVRSCQKLPPCLTANARWIQDGPSAAQIKPFRGGTVISVGNIFKRGKNYCANVISLREERIESV